MRSTLSWSYTGFKDENEAEAWLDKAEEWFKVSKKDWKDWALSNLIGGKPEPGMIRATFTAEYDPQQ